MGAKLKMVGTVYILKARYKDNDDEVMGAFRSTDAMIAQFASIIASDRKGHKKEDLAQDVARLSAALLGMGSDRGCVDGRTDYWYEECPVWDLEGEES